MHMMQVPSCKGPVQFSPNFEPVRDPDEEKQVVSDSISESPTPFRGLGYVDSHKDFLEFKFEVNGSNISNESGTPRRKRKAQTKRVDKTIEIELHQDKTALRTRKGDTGSVVWKASVDFARLLLEQYHSRSSHSLLDTDLLVDQHVLELGGGTGFLSIALSPLVKQYTVTDIAPLIPLIMRNVSSNRPSGHNILVEELDWTVLESASPSQRCKVYNTKDRPIDLLLAVDCLYNPSLIPPFVAAINYLATPSRTAVLIVSELRADDVMREFLDAWLNTPGWEIWRIPNDDLGKHYVVWLGWKSASE